MTKAQIREAKALANTMPREDIAKTIGVSVVNLKRSMPGQKFWFKNGKYKNNPELVKKVLNYYFKHGKPKTVERFPEINVKAVVDRPEYYGIRRIYRQIRWTDAQLIDAAKMAGLVSLKGQAKFFNRPRAFEGSIQSLWNKRFGYRGGSLNGMVHWYAKELVNSNARYLRPVGTSREGKHVEFRRLILWVDMEKNLKPDAPQFMQDAIKSMADFQRWLWKSDNPKPLIMKMIKEREIAKKRITA